MGRAFGATADMAIGTVAAAMPAWAAEAQEWAIWYCAVAGAALVTLRILLLIRAALLAKRIPLEDLDHE